MIIKLPSGELRDEIPYSFSFRGRSPGALSGLVDHEYFDLGPAIVRAKDKHSLRIKSMQVSCEHPTLVSFLRCNGDLKPIELANWSAVSHFLWETSETNRGVIDIDPRMGFGVSSVPLTEKVGDVLVVFNGVLRRPIAPHY